MRYIYLSAGNCFVQLVSFVGYQIQNGPAFILQNHQAAIEHQAMRRHVEFIGRTVYGAGRCVSGTHHIYGSDLVNP